MAEERKVGLYICSAFGIGEAVDCEKMKEDLAGAENVALVKVMENLFTQEGVDEVKKDIEENGLNAVVIGGSSPRYHTELFRFGKDVMMDRVNLREQVAWMHEAGDIHTYNMALDYMKMGLAKVNVMEYPEPLQLDINETVMVIGGGVTGMNAALAASKADYHVILIEKEAEIGGFYNKLYKTTPFNEPYLDLQPSRCAELIAEVKADKHIKVLTNTKVKRTDGAPGMYDVTAMQNGEKLEFQVGSIVQATGWKQYNPEKLGHLGYGSMKNVITNLQLEEMAKNGDIKKPSDNSAVKTVVFVQCAGSRDENHLPYCSGYCCMTSLKQSLYVREQYPDAQIFVIYKDMRTPGQYESFYKRVQAADNIFLTKGEISSMVENESGIISVDVDDTLIGENITINADLVVLATGMVPSTKVEENGNGEQGEETELEGGKKAAAGAESGAQILQLTYRQGTDLPTLHYGFPDSHYICFPYETRRTGVYAAGTVRAPMDMATAKNDAYGAALKAIQVIEAAKNGCAVHPRSGDTSFPDFFLQRCTQCKRCTEECPFGTLDEDTKGTPKPNPTRCRRCGICMGACPERIISFKNYSVRMISNMIKSIYVPTEEEDGEATPRILCFMCENDAYPSLDTIARSREMITPNIRIIPVRCLGSVNTSWIADSLSQGFDGVILFGCKYGDDYQCHFIHGSMLANKRMENVQEKLKQLVLEPERVELHMLSIDEYHKLPEIINNFAATIDEVGPNPYKEM